MSAVFFLDSNIVVKYYITEPGSAWVRNLIDAQNNTFFISELSIVEVAAALSQMRHHKQISRRAMQQSYDRFLADMKHGRFLAKPIDFETIERAYAISLQHALKGADAIQVATAALFEDTINVEVVFISNDRQALRVAQLEALMVEDPAAYMEDLES